MIAGPLAVGQVVGQVVVGAATALVLLAVAVLPFLSPAWISFAQDRAGAAAWTGYSAADLRIASDALVHDLVLGGDFDVEVGGQAVLSEPERAHMRDVRALFVGFYVAALVAAAVGAAAAVLDRGGSAARRAIRGGAIGLAGGLVIGALIVAFAFDAAFTIFHGLFFAAGTWTFDPRTDRLVELFPEQFFTETALAVGAVAFMLALVVARVAGRRR